MRAAYTIQTLSQETGLGVTAIKHLIYNGHLRARKIGTRWYIPASAAKELFEGEGHVQTDPSTPFAKEKAA